jgi:DNA polymerase-1
MKTAKKLFLIDVMAMAFRTYHAFAQRPLRTTQGLPTSAVYGTVVYLLKLIAEEKPDYLVLVSDSKEKNFRHELYQDYKANRTEMPEDLALQIPYIFKLFTAMGLPLVRQAGFEADDLIGSLVRRYADSSLHCYIVSGDKDFYQLVDAHTFIFTPKKGGTNLLVDATEVRARFHCAPSQVIDLLALWGDSADNIPGVPGVGEKSAIKLIEQFSSIDRMLEESDAIANRRVREAIIQHREKLLLARKLVTIKTDIPVSLALDEMRVDQERLYARQDLYDLCKHLEFNSLCERLLSLRTPEFSLEGSPRAKQKAQKKSAEPLNAAPVPVPEGDYTLINNEKDLSAFIARAKAARVLAFDSETTGLNLASDKPIGISFALKAGEAVYLPLVEAYLEGLSFERAIALLKELFAIPTLFKVAHNLKFDLQMLDNIGLSLVGELGDTMLAAFVCNATENSFSLADLSAKYLGLEKIPIESLIGKKRDIPMSAVPLAQLMPYACRDADCCLQLFFHFLPQLEAEGLYSLYHDVEIPLAPILGDMEKTGIFVDREILAGISKTLSARKNELEKEIHALAGEEININSPKQLQAIIFEKLNIPEQLGIKRLKKNKNGYSTDVSVLESLAAHPLPEKILAYRSVSKLQNTYVDVLPTLIDPRTGRIHTSFHQAGTATGRLSSSNPNLQNIPIQSPLGREIRRAFRAAPGRVMVSADYSQIELRILAHIADEKTLRAAFLSDQDIHTQTAAQLLQKAPEEVSHGERSQAKAINYGIVYGMGPQRLAQEIKVSPAEAKKFIESYFAHFPAIEGYITSSIAFAKEHGYSQTILGRRRQIFGLDGSQGAMAQVAARNIAINSPIQGSAADLIKLAMREIYRELATRKLKAKMLLQVHDELLFECPKEEWDELRGIVTTRMEEAYPLSVPLKVNIAAGADWLEAH